MSAKEEAQETNKVTILSSPVGLESAKSRDRLVTDLATGNLPGVEQLVTSIVTNISGDAQLLVGTVTAYTSATTSGTVDINGSSLAFLNASSVRLEVGDVVLLSASKTTSSLYAVGLVTQSGGPAGYDTYGFVVPSSLPDLPRNLAYTFGWFFNEQNFASDYVQQYSTTTRVLTASLWNQRIEIENWDLGTLTVIPAPVDPANIQVLATPTVIAWTSNALGSNTGELYVHYAGVTTSYAYEGVQLAGINSGVIIATAHTEPGSTTGNFIVEIDAAGVVTHTDTIGVWSTAWDTTMPGPIRYSRAGGGNVVIVGEGSPPEMYVNGTIYTAPSAGLALPRDGFGNGTGQHLRRSDIVGDILYWVIGEGATAYAATASPRLGLARMDLNTPNTIDYFPDLLSVTGSPQDGEPMRVSSLAALDDGNVVIGGSTWTGFINPSATAKTSDGKNAQATYWITNGTTTQTFVPSYTMLDPEDLSGPTLVDDSIATVSSDLSGSQYTVVYRRANRFESIIDGGTT
jgi:hypothetical protein